MRSRQISLAGWLRPHSPARICEGYKGPKQGRGDQISLPLLRTTQSQGPMRSTHTTTLQDHKLSITALHRAKGIKRFECHEKPLSKSNPSALPLSTALFPTPTISASRFRDARRLVSRACPRRYLAELHASRYKAVYLYTNLCEVQPVPILSDKTRCS